MLPMPLAPRAAGRARLQPGAVAGARTWRRGKTDAGLLLRVRAHRRRRPRWTAQARLRNVRGAFAVEPLRAAAAARQGACVLVDDVMTSGASLFAAAQALRQAGAAHVAALVLARTDDPPH